MEHNAFSCPICFKAFDVKYNIPRIIASCGHTLCSSCIQIMSSKNKWTFLECPLDKKKHQIKVKDIEEFPKNYSLIYILEQRNLQKASYGDELKQCPIHNDLMKFICVTCKLQICAECAFEDSHSDHEMITLEKLANRVGNKIHEVEECLAQIDAVNIDLKEHVSDMIDLKRSTLIKQVEEKFSICFDELSSWRDKIIKQLKDHLKNLENKYEPKKDNHLKTQVESLKWAENMKETLEKWHKEKNLEAGVYLYSGESSKNISELKNSLKDDIISELKTKLNKCEIVFSPDIRKLAQSLVQFKSTSLDPPPLLGLNLPSGNLLNNNNLPPPSRNLLNGNMLPPPIFTSHILPPVGGFPNLRPPPSLALNRPQPDNIIQARIISSPIQLVNNNLQPPQINLSNPPILQHRSSRNNSLSPPNLFGNQVNFTRHLDYLAKDGCCEGICLYDSVAQEVVESKNFELSSNRIKMITTDNYGTTESVSFNEFRELNSLLTLFQNFGSFKLWLNGEKWAIIQSKYNQGVYSTYCLTNEKDKILCVGKAKKIAVIACYNKTKFGYNNMDDCMAKVIQVQSTLIVQGL